MRGSVAESMSRDRKTQVRVPHTGFDVMKTSTSFHTQLGGVLQGVLRPRESIRTNITTASVLSDIYCIVRM